MNKTAFVVSIVLTTFVLMAVAGIAYAVNASQKAEAANLQVLSTAAPVAADSSAQPADGSTAQQDYSQREAAYQALIAQANARLQQAQQQEKALQDQLNALQSAPQPAAASQAALTPDQAVNIAENFLGQTSVYSIETVQLNGASVFMVTFSSGDIVYVSMDGQIAGSVAAQQSAQVSTKVVLAGSGGEHEHDDHESGDH